MSEIKLGFIVFAVWSRRKWSSRGGGGGLFLCGDFLGVYGSPGAAKRKADADRSHTNAWIR